MNKDEDNNKRIAELFGLIISVVVSAVVLLLILQSFGK